MNREHRAYLEAIATSDDPGVRPGDRVRAIELLHAHDPDDEGVVDAAIVRAAWLSGDELDSEVDAVTAAFVQLIRSDPELAKRFPLTVAAIGPNALTAQHFTALAEELMEVSMNHQRPARDLPSFARPS